MTEFPFNFNEYIIILLFQSVKKNNFQASLHNGYYCTYLGT